MSKKHCLRIESLPQEVVESILERLPVKSLLRFKAVSSQWKSTVESPFFQKRQSIHRQQSGDPDVLMVPTDPDEVNSFRTLVLGSSCSVEIPTPRENTEYFVCQSSCDGLICLYHTYVEYRPNFVVTPTTRWNRSLPLCQLQQLIPDLGFNYFKLMPSPSKLAFGKDKFTGTYKPVWLYNSSKIAQENATKCEVFDFSTNAWRYVTPSAPYRVVGCPCDPVYVDGSLHWFTDCKDTKVVSFDLHTEAFQVLSEAPFANAPVNEIVMCNLHNRLCVSLKKYSNQVIWSFDAVNKTWDQMCTIDLDFISRRFDIPTLVCALSPLALLDGGKKKKKRKKLLFYDFISRKALMTYDLETRSYDTAFSSKSIGDPVCYFPSLFSVS
ncbi:hypothetical protein EUTSA_v10009873mg [Eutrema salsugineum]|uniref:F-box domain-containing protein n=1 Tax=Eutrema salsugineum TaxID=72664 RepID=V4MTZ9_EUTSA|nr:F-box/LRR-repeat/kelch-repeat protein At1g09650 [Eutrema salsugineum]ESQ35366.1 hypothetical protein EUTSA_v10009873mg [Eutrema salsugineum]